MKKIICIALLVIVNFSCVEEKNLPNHFDYGSIENNTYINDFFGFRLPYNSEWSVLDKQQMSNITKAGKEMIVGDDNKLKKVVDVSSVNLAELFMIFKHELGTTTEFNPSLGINAENLNQFPNVKETKDYVVQAKNFMDQTKMNIDYRREDYEVKIGNTSFICLEIFNLDYNIYQDYYVTLNNGFAISMVVSYANEEDKNEINAMLDKMQFTKNGKAKTKKG